MSQGKHMVSTGVTWWTQAWRTLWRDARAGELRLLVVAVALGVAALSSVSFLADRLNGGLQRDARQLLGGDVVVVSDQATPAHIVQRAKAEGLQGVTTLSFPTMARGQAQSGAESNSRLVALKAVEAGYPLRGELTVASSLAAAQLELNHDSTNLIQDGGKLGAEKIKGIPARGEVWMEVSGLEALGLDVGDSVLLGNNRLRISRVLVNEPDRGAGFMNFAPRVLMNAVDLEATALVQPASRVTWRYAVVGADNATQNFLAWAEAESKKPEVRGVRVESLEAGRPEMRQTLDRAGKFLNLVALLAALLSAVAVALAARAFAARHLDDCAMLRVLGLSQRHIALSYSAEFVWVGTFASALGLALGYAVHLVFVALLKGLVETALPAPSMWPVVYGLGAGLTLLLAFGLPPVLQLASVPPLRVIRRDVGELKATTLSVWALGLAGFALLLIAVSRDLKLGLMVVGGGAAAVLLFAGMAWLAVQVLRRSVVEGSAPPWLMLATRQVSARPVYAMVQVSALAVGLLALALLVLLRTDLISSWRNATPVDAPNRFVINIQPTQTDTFLQTLRDAGVSKLDWYPMIRARLVAVNGNTVTPDSYTEERAQRLVDREFNVSFSADRPEHNTVVAGAWQAEEADGLSIEEGIAKTLKLKLGDTLRFDMAGVLHEARITSVRRVDWASMRANFFVMYPVSRMTTGAGFDVPTTYIAAFRAPQRAVATDKPTPSFDNQLINRFPNVTNVDMGATLNQVQSVLGQVVRAVEFLFLFTLAAGLVVLFAAVTATREERAREYAVLRALGASNQLLANVQRAELAGIGALAGLLATCVAMLMGWGLARFAFEFEWTASLWVPLLGAMVGALLALAAGWWGLRDVLRRPVVQTLRQAS
ncbi:inner membrane transport permease [Limnohabitans sp. MORI2]|uniref:ABC transporter permease n=1 Tax=Limnohabitans sp. MORI2 TaxID=1751150 RepID=UPI002377B6F5|nr:FtsX-like permease family protein [Limnohabitans sp. MORI2]BDU59074.1 inner membrane transport permease [Limnohabitans sp. MORI2]